MSKFPTLFSISVNKEESLFEVLMRKEDNNNWNFHFRRRLLAWEEVEVCRMQARLLNTPEIDMNKSDSIQWRGHSSGLFSVKSL